MNKNQTIVVGMSGGVDSSVVALLLKRQGYNVIGLHMIGENPDSRDADKQRVSELCDYMGIKFQVSEFNNHMQIVKDYFIKEYLSGRTPNPCVVCNREVKFKPFIDFANQVGADYFATGHYASIVHENGKHYLKKAKDENKDQTYFLSQLSQVQLHKALFPLGDLTKPEVRKLAEDNHLISSTTKDSYDVCFLGSEKFKDFMNNNYPEKPGNIVDIKTKKVVGKHNGISTYTLGQRKGLGIGGGYGTTGESWFVVEKDIINNILYVTQGDGEELLSSALTSGVFNWIPAKPNKKEFDCFAKFRYRQADQPVKIIINDDGSITCKFKQKQRAVTPGQYVVLYGSKTGECSEPEEAVYCLGGAVIETVIK